MARPLPTRNPLPQPKPDVQAQILATVITLDGRQQEQGITMQAMAEEQGRHGRRLTTLEAKVDEALAILRQLAPVPNGHPDPALADTIAAPGAEEKPDA
jgi:hypothetical protein